MSNDDNADKFDSINFTDALLSAGTYRDRSITVSRADLDALIACLGYLRASVDSASDDLASAFDHHLSEQRSEMSGSTASVTVATVTGLAEGQLRDVKVRADHAFNLALTLAGYAAVNASCGGE